MIRFEVPSSSSLSSLAPSSKFSCASWATSGLWGHPNSGVFAGSVGGVRRGELQCELLALALWEVRGR